MKSKVLLFAMFIATLCMFSSCDKEPVEEITGKSVTIYATLENGREWSEGDEVVINGATFVATAANTSTITIENVAEAEHYYAAYDFGSGSIAGESLQLELPAIQGSNLKAMQPMVASSTSTNLVLKGVMGELELNIEGNATITRAVLSSFDTALAGEGTIDLNFAGSPKLKLADSGSRSVSYISEEGIELPASIDVALPAAIYSGFVVTLYDAEGQVMSNVEIAAREIARGEKSSVDINYEPDAVPPTYITATLEQDAYGNAHTWSTSSVIYVNGTPVQVADAAMGEFGPLATAELYIASTSSTSVNGVSGNAQRVSIPMTQGIKASYASLNPAVAKSTTTNLAFTYLAGVVEVKVTGEQNLRKATLSSVNNRRLAGSGVVDMATDTPRLALGNDASKDVVFDCGTSGTSIEQGLTLRFVLPADDYAEGMTLTLEATTGQTYSIELGGCVVERNKVFAYDDIRWESHQNDGNDLSKLGYANCYMIHAAGDYSFKTRLVDNTPVSGIAKVDWLWASSVEGESGNALVSNINYENGLVTFTATGNEGNAVLAAFDEAGTILWSWHIWITDMPAIIDFKNNAIPQSGGMTDGYYCMDRNLGATSARREDGYETFGLYYQWGRKDPFIGDRSEERTRDKQNGGWMTLVEAFGNSHELTVCNPAYAEAEWVMTTTSVENGSIAYATAHPMTYLYGNPSSSKADWVMKDNFESSEWNNIVYDADKSLWRPFQKSNYDPCPVGYQVPRKAMWVSLVSTSCVFTQYEGFEYNAADGQSVWFPLAGYRSAHPSDVGTLMSVQNDTGFIKLWSSELEVAETAYSFTFNDPYYNAATGSSWANGYNVRCVRAY